MVKINLLPPEILERRRYERFYPYIFIATAILIGITVVAWVILSILVGQQNAVLQQTEQTTAELNAQAESLAVFEKQRSELQTRQQAVTSALAGRIDMGALAEDVSLVLPEEVYAVRFKCSEDTGLELECDAPVADLPGVKEGYKSAAATLVRLAALEQLYDVWLVGADVDKRTTFQPVAETQNASSTVLSFQSTGDIKTPDAAGTGQ